jgi:hypothetical protein
MEHPTGVKEINSEEAPSARHSIKLQVLRLRSTSLRSAQDDKFCCSRAKYVFFWATRFAREPGL